MNPSFWNTLTQCLSGVPFIPIGSHFFNLLAIEQAYHFPSLQIWQVRFTNKAVMVLSEDDAARLAESFKDAPFAVHDSVRHTSYDRHEGVSTTAYFNVATAVLFECAKGADNLNTLRVHLMSGESITINDANAFKSHLESALVRARLAMSTQPGNGGRAGKR